MRDNQCLDFNPYRNVWVVAIFPTSNQYQLSAISVSVTKFYSNSDLFFVQAVEGELFCYSIASVNKDPSLTRTEGSQAWW